MRAARGECRERRMDVAQKEYDDDDPMELIGVAFPLGEVGEMAEAIVEEFIKERGAEYVKALI